MILVDTNIWIDALKNPTSSVIAPLSAFVLDKQACMNGIIRAELLSGARSESEYRFLEGRLVSVPVLAAPETLWDDVAWARFRLARLGFQEGLMDIAIACYARHHHAPLWTSDKQFTPIHKVIPFKRFYP